MYSWRGKELVYSWRGGGWCTVREGGVELVYSWRGGGGAGVQL